MSKAVKFLKYDAGYQPVFCDVHGIHYKQQDARNFLQCL